MVKVPKPSIGKQWKKDEDVSKSKGASVKVSRVTKKTGKLMKTQLESQKKIETSIHSDRVKKTMNEESAKTQLIFQKDGKFPKVSESSKKGEKIMENKIAEFTSEHPIVSKVASMKKKEHRASSSDAPRAPRNEVKFEHTTIRPKKRSSEKSLPLSKGKLKTSKAETSQGKLKKTVFEDAQKLEAEPKRKLETKKMQVMRNAIGKVGNLEVTKSHVRKCVQAVVKLTTKKKEDEKKTLLPDDNSPIFLQVTCIKVPKTPRRQLRIFLPHMMIGPTDEVALFVPDLEKGQRKNHEKTVDHWETVLRNRNITQIKEIIPMNKVKAEYSQYEMKLKLGRMFDFFLVDGRISGHMTHILGKTFRKSAQPPTPVKLQRDNLKSEIDNALRKTCMEIHGNGNCHTLRVGTITMPEQEIVDNIIAACKALKKDYPGGQENIRSIFIKSTKSLGIPVYFSIQNKNKVSVTKITPKRPKAFKTVEDELSTASGHVIVKLEPGGRIKLQKMEKVKQDVAEETAQ